jgi:hypothetical protein
MKSKTVVLVGALFVAFSRNVSADVITGLPGGTLELMPALGSATYGVGPHTFGPGITWTATVSSAVFGYPAEYQLTNGAWENPADPLAGIGELAGVGSMTFSFATPVAAILSQVSWSNSGQPVSMSVYDSADNLIETLQLSHSYSNDFPPGFIGFQESSAQISRIVYSNGAIAVRHISILSSISAVPGPMAGAGLPGLILGFAGIGYMAYRRKSKPALMPA